MRIMHLNFGRHYGGSEIVILDILKNQSKDIKSIVIVRKGSKFERKLVLVPKKNKHLTIMSFNMEGIYNIMKSILKLSKVVKDYEIDIIHVHGILANIVGTILKKLNKGTKLVTTIHSSSVNDRDNKLSNLVFSYIENKCLKYNDKIICVSKYLKDEIMENGVNPAKIQVIYNGINIPEQYSNDLGSSNNNQLIIGSFGRLEKVKGHEHLIKSIYLLRELMPNIKVLIVGEGSQKNFLNNLINKLNLHEHISLVGYKDDVFSILKTVDIVVLPSVMEGLSLSLLEALMFGKPVIASNTGGIPEVIEHMRTGILVEPENAEDLANAIKILYKNNGLMANFSKVGPITIKSKFSMTKMVSELEFLYSNVKGEVK